MAAGLNANIFTIFCTDFAHLKRGAHFTIQLILLLRDFYVILRCGLNSPTEVRIDASTIGVQVATKEINKYYTKIMITSSHV